MSGDPFSGLTDSIQERKQRGARARKQKWTAFGASLGATIVMAVATGVGATMGGGLVADRGSEVATDRLFGGVVCGLAGGVLSFLGALWRITRQTLVDDAVGLKEEAIDVGATLFWSAVAGAAVFGSAGGALGLAGKGGYAAEALGGAVAAALLALVPASALRAVARRTSRTGFGPAEYRK